MQQKLELIQDYPEPPEDVNNCYIAPPHIAYCNLYSHRIYFQKDGKKFVSVFRHSCDSWWCKTCRVHKINSLQNKLNAESAYFDTRFFLTLTQKSEDYKLLRSKFNQLKKNILLECVI
ncbi:MAG: hypothetical protein ACOCRO_10955 [Halanaerobiales bacterium]